MKNYQVFIYIVTIFIIMSSCSTTESIPTNTLQPPTITAKPPTPTDTPTPLPPTSTPTPFPPFRDDFNQQLEEGWKWLYELEGGWNLNDKTGFLRVEIALNAKQFLVRNAPEGNFEITTRVLIRPNQNFQQAGLVILHDDGHMLMFHRGYAYFPNAGCCIGNAIYYDYIDYDLGVPEEYYAVDPISPTKTDELDEAYLRLTREGKTYTAFYSNDGENWTIIGKHEVDWVPVYVGIQTRGDQNSTPADADFDYFTLEILEEAQGQSVITAVTATQEPSDQESELVKDIELSKPVPVIWDDDGSPDGVIALMYLLANPNFEVKAITVSYGEAYPSVFARKLTAMLTRLDLHDIPVAAGRETPLDGNHAFPESWREPTNQFWDLTLPQPEQEVETISAAKLIVDIAKTSPDPIIIFVSGSHTNLAEALRLDPSIKEQISSVVIMGGALFVEGNLQEGYPDLLNRTAEWNIWIDYLAASEVFSSGLPIYVTPLDATNQVLWIEEDADTWESSGVPEGKLAAELHRWGLGAMGLNSTYIWDLIAAVNLTSPELCQSENLYVTVTTKAGSEQGRTVVETTQFPNIIACIEPDKEGMREQVLQIFSEKP